MGFAMMNQRHASISSSIIRFNPILHMARDLCTSPPILVYINNFKSTNGTFNKGIMLKYDAGNIVS